MSIRKYTMAKLIGRCAVSWALAGMAGMAGMASAAVTAPWDGGYVGANVGDASSRTCNSWALDGASIDAADASQFNSRVCSKTGSLVGGLQLGENFQYKRLVWGVGADLDYWGSKTVSFKYSGAAPAAGAYNFSNQESPHEFAIIGPRIGYAGDTWLPYLRLGGIVAGGSQSELFYTPTGAKKPMVSFGGGKDFSTAGWAAGGGLELGLNGAWSIGAEYLHASLGKGSDSTGSCNGSAAACAAFSGAVLNTSHGGFTANIFRLGVTYWFNYWTP